MASNEGWGSIAVMGSHLSVGKNSIYRWVDSKDFPAHKVGQLLRFRLSELDEWVRAGGGNRQKTHQGRGATLAEGPDNR